MTEPRSDAVPRVSDEALATLLTDAAARWSVVLESPPRCSPTSCVALGRRLRTGEPVTLKAPRAEADEVDAWKVVRHFDGYGSVRVFGHSDGVVLLERAMPGSPLSDLVAAGRDDEATVIACDVAAALHSAPWPMEHAYGTFASAADWARGFTRYRHAEAAIVPPGLAETAAATYAELMASQSPPRLLHGDLQHFNILHDDARGWLAIDPKGVVAEPEFEFGALFRNPSGDGFDVAQWATPPVIARRGAIIAERLGFDRERLLRWAFAQAVLSAIWSWEDGFSPTPSIAVADAVWRAL